MFEGIVQCELEFKLTVPHTLWQVSGQQLAKRYRASAVGHVLFVDVFERLPHATFRVRVVTERLAGHFRYHIPLVLRYGRHW